MRSVIAAAGALVGGVLAQNGGPWEQCGGIDFHGQTSCVSGHTCVYQNDWYSQCLPGSDPGNPGNPQPTTTDSGGSTPTSAPGTFEFFGVNEAGAEFGTGVFPGTWGTEFIFPDNDALQVGTSHPFLVLQQQQQQQLTANLCR